MKKKIWSFLIAVLAVTAVCSAQTERIKGDYYFYRKTHNNEVVSLGYDSLLLHNVKGGGTETLHGVSLDYDRLISVCQHSPLFVQTGIGFSTYFGKKAVTPHVADWTEKEKMYLMSCHLAGRMYHDADEVWDKLKIGTKLRLVRDEDNRYDPKAIAVVYDSIEEDKTFILGYIPRSDNFTLSVLLDMGWTHIFECRICQVSPDAHPEQQIQLVIKVKRNKE